VTIGRRVIGAVLVLIGLVWIGQGTTLIQGSSMTGSTFWAVMGAICFVGGLVLLGWPWRQPRDKPS
jgi:peptidoglycan/LPS O-acetylase OafA/YrhL